MTEAALSTAPYRPSAPPGRPILLAPQQGWLTLLLHTALLAATAASVLRFNEGERGGVLIPLAVGGLLVGHILARTPALDAVAHLMALVSGAGASLCLCAIRIDGLDGTWRVRGRNVYELAERLLTNQFRSRSNELSNVELLAIVGITLWLAGYSSAWMLYRRHWLMPALVVPGTLMFISLKEDGGGETGGLAVFAAASIVLAARHHHYTRKMTWARARMDWPARLGHRFTAFGSAFAVVALLIANLLTLSAPERLADELAHRMERYWEQSKGRFDEAFGLLDSDAAVDDYENFPPNFEVDDPFTPVEPKREVAWLDADRPTYLAARRYDRYDGVAWRSDVDATFRLPGEDEDVRAITIIYRDNQNVALTLDVNAGRQSVTDEVTILVSKGSVLLTTHIFQTAGIPFLAVMGWERLENAQFDVERVEPGSAPIDLQYLITKLNEVGFTIGPDGQPVLEPGPIAEDIERERARLLNYPLETRFALNGDGSIVLIASGRVPNYDDVEAVYAGAELEAPYTYRVTGLISMASETDLRSAGTTYPNWVTERYLQLPAIPGGTRGLALEIGAQATNPFDRAQAIETYLRENFGYELNSPEAAEGRDAVDFFLFDKRVGDCKSFASAMVILLRQLGIPARIVAGYYASPEVSDDGRFVYREEQAHTWVEVFFPAYGWIPFEPTPGRDRFGYGDEQIDQGPVPFPTSAPEEPSPTPESAATLEPTPTPTPAPPAPNTGSGDDSTSWQEWLSDRMALAGLAVTGIVAVVAGVLGGMWLLSFRGLSPGGALYARALRIGKLWGIEPAGTTTPAEYAVEFGRSVPRVQRAISVVADLYSAERYGGVTISEEHRRSGAQAWRALRSSIISWRPWRRRRGR